ncbi:hypothetical protein [Tenacibaculum sp.]|uniref:hypothetical protein n=1 Tax=Tenacibaculum sp. TaxID=1906242 RepID=UPI003D151A38
MVLGIAEDFTSSAVLDAQLKATQSGLYLNSGVHPSITVNNLLQFLPNDIDVTTAWNSGTTYGVFETSRSMGDLVTKNSKIFQSIKANNTNQDPETETTYWLETNMESLRLRSFVLKVLDRVKSDLHLTKRLVDSQFIYEVGTETVTLPNDYAAWVFEPKGSDYVTIRLNQVSFQKASTDPVSLYVINQGVLVDTLSITPSNGVVEFKDLGYTFKGKGKWIFAIDSTDVKIGNGYVDTQGFEGFVCYTATGIGNAPETATYSNGNTGNGLGFNVTAYLDSSLYFDNNINEFGNFVKACFEYMVFTMYLHNSNNKINFVQMIQMDKDLLMKELKILDSDTVVKRYYDAKKKALKQIEKTFDSELFEDDGFEVEITTI